MDGLRQNRRHVYNINDYLHIGGVKGKLIQCFTHQYRQKTYAFLVVYLMRELRNGHVGIMENADATVVDSVLGLPVYWRREKQWVFGLPAVSLESLYMVSVPNEVDWPDKPHVLDCTWGVDYL